MRVQIPAYTDAWMQGDRYGEVTSQRPSVAVRDKHGNLVTIARVKLDLSGKTKPFIFEDCEVIE